MKMLSFSIYKVGDHPCCQIPSAVTMVEMRKLLLGRFPENEDLVNCIEYMMTQVVKGRVVQVSETDA